MVLTIYGHPLSPPTRAVVLFARLANIQYEYVLVDLVHFDNLKPDFLAINAAGEVPAIVDGDFKLSESHAILTYLHATRQAEDRWYPADPKKRALVDRYLHWHHGNLRKSAYDTYSKIFAPMRGYSIPEAVVSAALETRAKSFIQLEAWLTATPYIAGEEVTIADLAALCEITNQRLVDFDLSPYPHVQAWVNGLLEIPVVAEEHQALFAFKAELEAKKRETEAK